MTQRVTMVAAVLASVGCLATAGLVWRMLGETRQQNRELLALLSANAHSMSGSSGAAAQPAAASVQSGNVEWQPVRVRLQSGTGKPVSATVNLRGKAIAGGEISQTLTTDSAGVADFGSLPVGEYVAACSLDELKLWNSKSFLLGPGRPNEIEIDCPEDPPGTFPLAFDLHTPGSLAGLPLYYFADINFKSQQFEGEDWRLTVAAEHPVLLLDSKGDVLGQAPYDRVTVQERNGSGPGYFISFLESLPADFPLEPAEDLKAYNLGIRLWPLVQDPEADASMNSGRPPLKRLTGAALEGQLDIRPAAGQPQVVQLDHYGQQFWRDVKNDLARLPSYKSLANP